MRINHIKEQGVEQEAAAKERFWADMGEVYRIYEEGMRGHYRFYSVLDSINLACTRENGSLGMQCDKIADFSEGTDAKSANLPKNPQSLHSHTANTNFFACSSNPTESTPSEAKPSVEIQENTESKESLDSSLSSSDSESATLKNPSEALPNINNSACVSTSRAQLQNCAIFATQKSNQISRAEHPQEASSGWGGEVERGGGSDLAIQAPSPLSHKTSDIEKQRNIRENTTLRNRESKVEILGNIESKADSEKFTESHTDSESRKSLDSRFKVLGLDSEFNPTESKIFTESTSTDSQTIIESNPAVQELKSTKTSQATITDINPKDLAQGDIIVLYAGEMLPCDSVLLEENASFDTAAISGESLPVECKKGEEILSGSIAINKAIKLQVLRPFAKSQIAQIADLIASATLQKSPTENFITTFARYYTPIVFAFALALALIPPLVFAQSFEEWAYRALVVLMVSCPCALVVSVPIGYFGGLAAAAKRGALIKGSNYLEALSKLSTIAFDKTGTLTKGAFEVIDVCPSEGFSKDEVLFYALCAQNLSNHPIAKSIRQAYQNLAHTHAISEYEELSGLGVRAVCDNHEILAGNDKILHTFGIAHNTCYVQGSVVHIARDRQYLGYILIADALKAQAPEVVERLRDLGVDSLILSGDGEYPCRMVAQKLGCEYHHSLLPQDKARIFSEIKAQASSKVAFVGDGINDAPTLALADVGVAMGSGSDISTQSADVIITNNSLKTLLSTIEIAKKTKTIIYQNIALALGIKGVFIVLGLFGLASIWEAIFGDVGVALLALANAMRCSRVS